MAWTLLKTAQRGPGRMSLQSLLTDFLGPEPGMLFPDKLLDHTVHLERGLACNVALGPDAAGHTFLELLARPDGDKLLLHRTQQTAAGADLAFLAERPGTAGGKPRQRLVLVQVKNASSATAADMLRSVDLGQWYPDSTIRKRVPTGSAGTRATYVSEKVEARSHAALRRVLADHPDWADPVRVLVSARPWAEATKLTAAWVNIAKVPAQPILLAHLSEASVGVKIRQQAATSEVHPPDDTLQWWPTRVRHWPNSHTHPQLDSLSLPPSEGPKLLPSRRVHFSVKSSVPQPELKAVATASRDHRVLKATKVSLDVEFSSLKSAMLAVEEAEAGLLMVRGFVVAGKFLH